jgi:hypothetical protein
MAIIKKNIVKPEGPDLVAGWPGAYLAFAGDKAWVGLQELLPVVNVLILPVHVADTRRGAWRSGYFT